MRKWTDEELKAASDANEAVELGLAMLLDIMKEHHCSKAKLAEALGVSRQSVSQVFKGTQYFTVRQIRTMAGLFRMTPEEVCACFALASVPDKRINAVTRMNDAIDRLEDVCKGGASFGELRELTDDLIAVRDILF